MEKGFTRRLSYSRSKRAEERSLIRKRNITEYFLSFSRVHREWLQELADKYKEYGVFPVIPMSLLPSYYESHLDKEVAAFAALLIKDAGRYDDNLSNAVANVKAFKDMMGESPWQWFKNREFVRLSLGAVRDNRTGGVSNWRIAKMMDALWVECSLVRKTRRNMASIGEMVDTIARLQRCSRFDVLTYLLTDCGVGEYFYKLRLLLMVLCTDDGVGLSLWNINKEKDSLKVPLALGIKDFLATWMPDCKRVGSTDEAIALFGLRGKCDFFYAWLGYKELQKRNPKGCSIYATTYFRWYENCIIRKPYHWRLKLPEIEF